MQPGPSPAAVLPDSLMTKDAVILMEKCEFVYRLATYKNYSEMLIGTQSLHKQVKMLSKRGLESYSIISIPKTRYTEIDKMDVFLIKPNGTVVREKTDMREIRDPDDDSDLRSGQLRFSIPGAEIGDIVDFSITLTNPSGGGYPIELFFHEELPILNSSTTLRFTKQVKFKIQGYNGLELPRLEDKKGDSVYHWEFAYIPAMLGIENSIRENELPFCKYMITGVLTSSYWGRTLSPVSPPNWGTTFEPNIQGISRPSPKGKKKEYFNELMARLLKGCDTCSKLSGFYKAFTYIRDSVKLVHTKERENYSSGYYLWNKSIDRFSLYVLYKDLFNYFGYKGYFVFARNKFNGMLDVNWVTRDFYTHLWLAFKDENGILHYIFPDTYLKKFQIDEMDPVLMGTKAYLVNAENAFDYSEIILPSSGFLTNTKERIMHARVMDDHLDVDVQIIRKGCISTSQRIRMNMLDQDSLQILFKKSVEHELENFSMNDISLGKPDALYPFTLTTSYSGIQSTRIIPADDSVFTINLSFWLDHSTITTDLESRNLDYYLSFPFQEKLKSEYSFPGPVELINGKSLTTSCDNDFATYSLLVQQAAPDKISIESIYSIKSAFIPATRYLLLKEVNLRQRQFKDAKLIIRKLY